MKVNNNQEAENLAESIKQKRKGISEIEESMNSLQPKKREAIEDNLSSHAQTILSLGRTVSKNESSPSTSSTVTNLTTDSTLKTTGKSKHGIDIILEEFPSIKKSNQDTSALNLEKE